MSRKRPKEPVHRDFRIAFSLVGTGWADCQVSAGGDTVALTASYLNDALGQLATATLLLCMGAPSARLSFAEEPGEYRWGFDWHESHAGAVDGIRVRIWSFPSLYGLRPDDDGELLFDKFIEEASFFQAVRSVLDDVLARYGLGGYQSQWAEHAFPWRVHAALNELLDAWPGGK